VARKSGERELLYGAWARESRTIVFYESPQRLATTLGELATHFPRRRVAVAREITKLHEEVIRGNLEQVAAIVAGREVLGEIVVVLDGAPEAPAVDDHTVRAALADQLAGGASVRDAVSFVADSLGVAHRSVYRLALELRAKDGS
jgi:16S rRNA (cytidine1402-2'-O)-methyltransferase